MTFKLCVLCCHFRNRFYSFKIHQKHPEISSNVLDVYHTYMRSTFEQLFTKVYPDKSSSIQYDIKKARSTPYAARLMLKYYDEKNANQLESFYNTAIETFQGTLSFEQQSPDTRGLTFAGGVIYDQFKNSTPLVDYLINRLNEAVHNGVPKIDIISCRSKVRQFEVSQKSK